MEDGGERWSKPYVATLSLHSLFELRSCLINGSVLLDMRASSIEEISGTGKWGRRTQCELGMCEPSVLVLGGWRADVRREV